MTKPKPLDLKEVYNKIWRRISEEWQEGLDKFNKEGIVIDFPFDEDEEIVKLAIKRTIKEIKQRIKSACKFYLRYKDKPELFAKQNLNLKKEMLEKSESLKLLEKTIISLDKYNEWLFKLSFKKMLKVKENE